MVSRARWWHQAPSTTPEKGTEDLGPVCSSRGKRRMDQRQGWRQSCKVDLKPIQEAGTEAITPLASLVQGLMSELSWCPVPQARQGQRPPVRFISTYQHRLVDSGH